MGRQRQHYTAKGLDNNRANMPTGEFNAALPAAIIWNRSGARKENSMAFLTRRTTTKPKGRLLWRGG